MSYSTDSNNMGTFSFRTEAYFRCDVGFFLIGNETRTCGDGNVTVGEFNGTTPACEGIIIMFTIRDQRLIACIYLIVNGY